MNAFPLQLSNSTHFLDASLAESIASPTHILFFITGFGKLAGTRLVGQTEISLSDLQDLIKVSLVLKWYS